MEAFTVFQLGYMAEGEEKKKKKKPFFWLELSA